MKDITFRCPHCGQEHVIEGRGAGLTVSCPQCGAPIVVPPANTAIAPATISTGVPAAGSIEGTRPGQEMTNGIGMVLCWCPPG